MSRKSLFWKIPTIILGVVIGLVLLLLIAAAGIIVTPAARTAVLQKGIEWANENTDLDIDLGRIYLSPFHHSPKILYQAYKGESDLPLTVEIDSLFVGHRHIDTLIYIHALRLNATLLTANSQSPITNHQSPFTNPTSIPIVVEQLHLDQTTFHSDSLIAAVGIDALIGNLDVTSPELIIAKGQYPLHGLRLADTYVGIDLRDTPPDTTAQDTTPMLMAFDVPDGELRNIHFALTPLGMHVRTKSLSTNVLADVGHNLYDARRLNIEDIALTIGSLTLPFDTLYGDARVDLDRHAITSRGLHVTSKEFGAKADLYATRFDLDTMKVDILADAEYQGSLAHLQGFYDIDDEAYNMQVNLEKVNLSPFLPDSTHTLLAGDIHAEGQGIDPNSPKMRSKVHVHLPNCEYDNIDASGITLDAELANQALKSHVNIPKFQMPMAGENLVANQLDIHFATDTTTALDLTTNGLQAEMSSPMFVMDLVNQILPLVSAASDSATLASITSLSDLTQLDTLRRLIPELAANIVVSKGSPAQPFIERMGLDINEIAINLASDKNQTGLTLDASIPDINHPEDSTALRLPAAKAAMRIGMTEGKTVASLEADSRLTDGAMSMHDLRTNANARLDLVRKGRDINGSGCINLDSLAFGTIDFGSRAIDIEIEPSKRFANALKADVWLDDIPLDLVDNIIQFEDLDLEGAIHAKASVDGLPNQFDLSAEVLPKRVSALYKPYAIQLGLGETPVVMEHNKVDFNGLPIYGVDSTFLALTGGLDLNSMLLDIQLAADSFAPAKLDKGGPAPVYGDLAMDIHGQVTGSLDSILTDVDVTLLPTTDITYPIDKKNLAQVKPYGKVNVQYGVADGSLNLGGRINVDNGFIRYSPKIYPVMPFHVDSGSHITFNGPVGKTKLAVSASQKTKAAVQAEGEESRLVDFTTGVRVKGEVDSIGINAIEFFLEAPNDEAVTNELASVDEGTREGLAATLLATGMYMGESNTATQNSGYALTSIINSRINAAMENSKRGKVIDIDFSSAKTQRAIGETNDLNIDISKSFFNDRLRISLGASLADNPEAYKNAGFFNNLSAEYKLTKTGSVSLRAFAQRDYNNIFEGELFKSGIGIRTFKEWDKTYPIKNTKWSNEQINDQMVNDQMVNAGDSITRTYGLMADADVAWRSNNSIGPNLTLTHTIKNLLGKGETLTVKGNGAYYWALRNRHPGDPKRTDTYKLGVNTSLLFPYLHWAGSKNPVGDTRYMVGYQYENIAGGYGVHKVSGSLTYIFRTSKYITHAFTPFSLAVVRVKAESDSLLNKAAEYPQIIKILASNEFTPAIGYNFTYNDYRAKRAVNTMLSLGVKEAGNLINAIYCAFGYKWDDIEKPLGKITFNQFVKLTAELRNKFNFTDKICIATRLYAGANIPLGNSLTAPLSEAFYIGGPNSMRAASPYAYGPGNFYSEKYNQSFFHAGDVKLEANFEFRFPIVWKLYGATFVDAGNVWNWYTSDALFKAAGMENYKETLALREDLYDGLFDNPYILRQIALGTGAGLRLDFEGLVIRLDVGVGIHAPFQTYKRDKEYKFDYDQPINTYFNMPSALDALRLNFGIGYPF